MPKRTCKVFFFGDSICFGQGVSPHKVWVARVSADLVRAFPDVEMLVQNPSVNGNTTRMALERMPYDVQSHSPDVLIVQFGMNDCNIWETDRGHQRVSPDGFTANLREIVARGRIFGAKRVLIGTNHTSTRTDAILPHSSITYETSNRQYNELSRAVARTAGAALVDNEKAIHAAVEQGARYDDFVLEDRLHLSEKGHDVYHLQYGPAVTAAVRSLLEG